MQQLTHIGLDVHKDTIAVAVLRPDTVTFDELVIPNTTRPSASCFPATATRLRSRPATRPAPPVTTPTVWSPRSALTAT